MLLFLKPPVPNALAFVGILLGIVGAVTLYWETVLSEEEIAIMAAQISRHSGDLESGDRWTITFNVFAGLAVFLNYIELIAKNFDTISKNRLILYFMIAGVILAIPPIATWGVLKSAAVWRFRRARKFDSYADFNGRKHHVSRSYRFTGMSFLIAGGWAQVPLILTSG